MDRPPVDGLAVGPGRGYIPAMSEPRKQSESTDPRAAPGKGVHPKTGKPMPKGGRKVGTPNKCTQTFRETITKLLEDNRENIALWVEQVANGTDAVYDRKGNLLKPGRPPDPAGALTRLGHLADFAAPRLSRQEQVGDGGGPLTVVIRKESDK